jgi:hypothetical protein
LSNLLNATAEETKTKKSRNISFYVREFVAASFWLFLFIKAFVYDLDLFIIRGFPVLEPLYPYKFFFFLGLLSVAWVVLRTKRFLKTIGYVLVYPLVLLLWRIPKLLFKNWALLVIFAPAIESRSVYAKVAIHLREFSALGRTRDCVGERACIFDRIHEHFGSVSVRSLRS